MPFSQKLDNLSLLPVQEIINKVLKNDAAKAFDIAAHAQFDLTYLCIQPTGGTDTSAVTLGSASTYASTVSSTAAFNNEHAKSVVDTMKERNIPAYTGDDYYAISWPTTLRVFRNNLEDIQQYTSEGFRMIANGEIGRYYNTRYVEQTNIAKAGWTNTDWIFFFGQDTVAEAIAVPEEMRGKIPADYGRSMGVAWYYLGGFGIVHNTSSYTQNRIVKWGSAG